MSYNIDFSRTSPNSTPGSESYRTFGRARTIEAIAIHWWGDPNNNPSYDGIVNFLCQPSAGVSAHFVASGTGRRVAQIVDFDDVSWATNSANPYTISIECDPRCRDEDYDVVAELIAQIRSAYGNLPLVPHRQFVSTACPGNYDLNRLNDIANSKDGSGDWGHVVPKNAPAPAPTPAPAKSIKYSTSGFPKTIELTKDTNLWDFNFTSYANAKAVKSYTKGTQIPVVAEATNPLGSKYVMTAYSYNGGNVRSTYGFNVQDVKDYNPPAPAPTPTPPPAPKPSDDFVKYLEDRVRMDTEYIKKLKG